MRIFKQDIDLCKSIMRVYHLHPSLNEEVNSNSGFRYYVENFKIKKSDILYDARQISQTKDCLKTFSICSFLYRNFEIEDDM